MSEEKKLDTGTLAEEMSWLSAKKRDVENQQSRVWGTGASNSEGNEAMTSLAMEVIEELEAAVKEDQKNLQYNFSSRISALEKGIREYRKLCAYYSEVRFNPGESKIRDFFLDTAKIVNIPENLPRTLWQLHYELGL